MRQTWSVSFLGGGGAAAAAGQLSSGNGGRDPSGFVALCPTASTSLSERLNLFHIGSDGFNRHDRDVLFLYSVAVPLFNCSNRAPQQSGRVWRGQQVYSSQRVPNSAGTTLVSSAVYRWRCSGQGLLPVFSVKARTAQG